MHTLAAPLLMRDERIVASAEQTGLARWFVFPSCGVVITTHRILFLTPSFFGLSFRFTDYHWEHVQDIHLSVGPGSASIRVTATSTKSALATHTVKQSLRRTTQTGLKKAEAKQVYSIGQQMEHDGRERKRQRAMEETRAAKGGYLVHGQEDSSAGSSLDPVQRLHRLKSMLESGVLTQSEHDAKRAEILAEL